MQNKEASLAQWPVLTNTTLAQSCTGAQNLCNNPNRLCTEPNQPTISPAPGE